LGNTDALAKHAEQPWFGKGGKNGSLRLVDTDSYIVITRTMERMRD
jgi:hypothetical protein